MYWAFTVDTARCKIGARCTILLLSSVPLALPFTQKVEPHEMRQTSVPLDSTKDERVIMEHELLKSVVASSTEPLSKMTIKMACRDGVTKSHYS